MTKITDQLEAAGYRKSVGESYRVFKSTDTLYQKRVRYEGQTIYFINCWYYEESGYMREAVQCEADLYRKETRIGVQMILGDFRSIEDVESEIESLWYCIGGTADPYNND